MHITYNKELLVEVYNYQFLGMIFRVEETIDQDIFRRIRKTGSKKENQNNFI